MLRCPCNNQVFTAKAVWADFHHFIFQRVKATCAHYTGVQMTVTAYCPENFAYVSGALLWITIAGHALPPLSDVRIFFCKSWGLKIVLAICHVCWLKMLWVHIFSCVAVLLGPSVRWLEWLGLFPENGHTIHNGKRCVKRRNLPSALCNLSGSPCRMTAC